MIVVCAACKSGTKDEPPPPVQAPPRAPAPKVTPIDTTTAAPPIESPVEVTARQLYALYKANEVAADGQYRGKLVRVSGRVAKVGKDVLGKPFLALAAKYEFEHVLANFDDEDVLAPLWPRQPVAVRCRAAGALVGSPVLNYCTLEVDAPADSSTFIPGPGKAILGMIDLQGGPSTDLEQKPWIESAVAVRNHCSMEDIKGDDLGDLWSTVAKLTVRKSAGSFVVTATFDDRRKAIHRGRAPQFEVDAKLTHIRAVNDDARQLCKL